MAEERQSNIRQENNVARSGMALDSSVNQLQKGQVSYALNAAVENFDENSINYQNEPGNELCIEFPKGYSLIGKHFIPETAKHVFFLVNPVDNKSEIGYMINNDCVYRKYINADCLNFNIKYPIHKAVHKITNCSVELYWTDGFNPRRYIDLDKPPTKTEISTSSNCEIEESEEIDCNKLLVQANFDIPQIQVVDVISGGQLVAGTVQFAIQYCDSQGGAYTSYFSVTNPTPIALDKIITGDFNYPVGKSVVLNIKNIDTSGVFKYFNLSVIKTVNNIPSVELINTYVIDDKEKTITYSGQNQTQIRLTVNEIFERFPYYEVADDLTAVQDILVWKGLTSVERKNFQQIANRITLQWETWRIPPTEDYSDELNATNLRGYLRDEIYPFEIVFLFKNGKVSDGFHIPGREKNYNELVRSDINSTNQDFIGDGETKEYWEIYNTASVLYTNPELTTTTTTTAIPTTTTTTTELPCCCYKISNGSETESYNLDWNDCDGNAEAHLLMPSETYDTCASTFPFCSGGDGNCTDVVVVVFANDCGGDCPDCSTGTTTTTTTTEPFIVEENEYKGVYQYGEFAYWESKETYPCIPEIWGELAGKPIRHHKFPDVNISPIFESETPNIAEDGSYTNLNQRKRAIFPLGVRIDVSEIQQLILTSSLTK
jgi:hypothetical protein